MYQLFVQKGFGVLGGICHSLRNIRRTNKASALGPKRKCVYRARPVNNVMVKLDDCEVSDERGIIYFIFTAITGFA